MTAPGGRRAQVQAHLLINLACLIWAGNMTVGRAARELIGPWSLVSLRAVFASFLFYALLKRYGRAGEPPLRSDWKPLLFMTLTGAAGYQAAFYYGLRFTNIINASVIHALAPLATIVLAAVVLKTVIRRPQVVGGWLSVAGVAIVVSGGSWSQLRALRLNPGDLLMLLAVVMWAGYSVAARQVLQRRSLISTTFIMTWMSALIMLPFGLLEMCAHPPAFGWPLVGTLFYVTVFAGVLAFLAWNRAVQTIGPVGAMAFMNMTPLYAAIASTILLAEPLTGVQLVGGILVVGGCLVAALVGSRVASPIAGNASAPNGKQGADP